MKQASITEWIASAAAGPVSGYTVDRAAFETYLRDVVRRETETMRAILHPGATFAVTPEFVEEMARRFDALVLRYVHTASLFAQARHADAADKIDQRKRARPLEMRESDFEFAWQRIQEDLREGQ